VIGAGESLVGDRGAAGFTVSARASAPVLRDAVPVQRRERTELLMGWDNAVAGLVGVGCDDPRPGGSVRTDTDAGVPSVAEAQLVKGE